MNRPKFLLYSLGFLVLGASIVWAGSTTLTTYYPAPTGNYNQLTSNYVSIGTSTMGQALVVMPAAGNNGNVGIGTTAPSNILHLYSNGSTPVLQLYSNRSGSSSSPSQLMQNSILFGGVNNQGWSTPNGAGIDFSTNYPAEVSTGRLNFWAYPNTSASPVMSVWNGNVGIATTTPPNLLSLTSSGASSALQFNVSAYPTMYAARVFTQDSYNGQNGGIDLAIESQNASTWYTAASFSHGQSVAHPSLRTWYTTELATNGGNVGIGNTNPTTLLQVGNGGGTGKLTVYSQDGNYGEFEIGNPASGGEASMAFISGVAGWGASASSINGSSYVWDIGANNYGIGGNAFGIGNQAYGGVILAVQSSGNVGIGSTSPGYKLDVNGYAHFTRTMTGSINTWGQTDWGAAADIRASTSGIPFSSLNNSNSQLLLDSDDGPVAIAWHRPGIWGAEFGLDTDNQFSTQGWSAGGGYTGMKVGNFTVNGNEQINGRSGASSYLVASSFTDLVNNAPWYGLGLPNFSGSNGGAPVQLAGYGGVYLQSASGNLVLNSNGNVYASGSITAASDRRLKQNIKPLTGTLSKLDQLRGVSFEWNHLAATSMRHKEGEKGIGMIAQELQKVYPELVLEAKNGRQAYLSIDYMKFTAVLLQAVKELKKEKDKEIQELQDENEQLRSRLDALEKKVRGDK